MHALFTPSQAAQLTNGELATWEAHALNRRDAYAAGREPENVLSDLHAARAELRRRREQRLARSWELLKSSAAS